MNDAMARLAAGAAGATSLAELASSTLPPLKELVGAGHALLYAYDERGRMVALGGDVWIPEVYWPYWAEDPTQAETKRLSSGPLVALADRLVGPRRFRRSRAYAEFYEPCEIEHLCCVFLTEIAHGSPGMTNIFLARGPKQEPYRARELSTVRYVLPILAAAVQRLGRLPPPGGEQALKDWGQKQPCFTTSRDGRVEWVSPAARQLLGGAVPVRLPDWLLGRASAQAAAQWRVADGRLFQLQLSPAGEERLLVLLSSAPAPPPDAALTPAEIQVMECLASGNSNLEIATILSISEHTVRTHLRNVYRKLGVCSRTEALLRWQARDLSA